MTRHTVDARGKPCPTPVIMARAALEKLLAGDSIEVILDDETAKENVQHFLQAQGMNVHNTAERGLYSVIAIPAGEAASQPDPHVLPFSPGISSTHVICIKSDRMGIGDNDLGDVLIRSFVNILEKVSPLPQTIIFYNSGILLALKDSPVIESLRALENLGVKIIVCGTCINHFRQKDNLAAGTISNMYEIAEILARAGHVIYP